MNIRIAAAVVSLGLAGTAMGQTTGVSHPEQVPILTNEDGIKQPVVYETAKPSAMVVPAVAAPTEPVLSASVVNDNVKLVTRPGLNANDADANVVTRVAGPANLLPVGTTVKVKMAQALSTKSTIVGTKFMAELVQPVERDGRVLLPAGSIISGRVTEVHSGKRISGRASMRLMPQQVTLPDGTIYPLRAQLIDTDMYKAMKVDAEGTILHKGNQTGAAAGIGLSTGAGAASGAVFGGWPGAIIGAGVGAGVSTVVWLKQDRQAELPAGAGVTFMLTEGLLVGDGR